ncbi:MAG TPA: tetratricopeptide repeat protein [Chloroflexia bacterium]|nr:tetratricopeptide repeat protein [Chloroflexia bacterium]
MQLYRYNNRKWFGAAVGVLIIGTLFFSFALIFNWLPKGGSLNVIWEVIRFVLAALVLIVWGILNVNPARPNGFIIAFAEFGQERSADGASYGLLRPERKRLSILSRDNYDPTEDDAELSPADSRFLRELKRIRNSSPTAELPGGSPGVKGRALPGPSSNGGGGNPLISGKDKTSSGNLVLAGRAPAYTASQNYAADGNSNTPAQRIPATMTRQGEQVFLSEFGDDDTRPSARIKFTPPHSLFAWLEVAGAKAITSFLQERVTAEINEAELKDNVFIKPLVFVKSRSAALREADVYKANAAIWGWNVYGKRRDFIPVFEFKEALESTRPARGLMQVLGLKSFDLGMQSAHHNSVFSAFVAGIGAYGYAGETRNKDEQLYYQKAKTEFNQALIASYMYRDRDHYQGSGDRAIMYFFLGNTYYYLNELDKAITAYREALAIDSEMIEARHNMGVVFYQQRKYDFAQKSLVKVIQLNPQLPIARLNLGVAFLAKKQYGPARRELQNAIKLDSHYSAAYRILGISYREEGDFEKAVGQLEEALNVRPDGKYPEARVDLALVYLDMAASGLYDQDTAIHCFDRASQELQKAISESPNLPDAHYHLARLLFERGQEDEAVAELLEAVRIRPGYSEAHEALAGIYEKRGRLDLRDRHLELMMRARQASSATTPEEHIRQGIGARLNKDYTTAREELEKALKMEPRNTQALFELGVVYQEMDELDRALGTFQAVLKLPNTPVDAYNRIANIKFQLDDRQGALDLLRDAVAHNPDNPNLHYFLGNAYRKQKTDGKAIESYIKAIQLDPEMAEPHFNLGMIYLNRRQFNDAILQFREVVRIRPEDHVTYLFLGRAYMRANQVEQAVAAIEEAVSLKSDYLEARLLLGEIYLRQAEPERAIEQLLMVQTYNPSDLRARELMGKAYAQAGQLERAIETFMDIIAVAPDSVSAHYNLGVSYVSQRRYRDAISEFVAVVQNKPDDADAYFNMGVAIHELLNGPDQINLEAQQVDNYFNQEVEAFRRAIQLRPTNPEPYRYLGQLYSRINNMELAMKYLNEYQRLKKQA